MAVESIDAEAEAGFKRGEAGAVVNENGVGAEGGGRCMKVNFLSCNSKRVGLFALSSKGSLIFGGGLSGLLVAYFLCWSCSC